MSTEVPPTDSPRRRRGRTWGQRITIAALIAAAVLSFVAAGVLGTANWVISSRNLVALSDQTEAAPNTSASTIVVPVEFADGVPTTATTEPEAFPDPEPEARNFLITGSDNNACIDPDSPFAPAFGDRTAFGERSDTIMVWRVNPTTNQVAILSFPRDLYVDIAGGGKARINTAYRRDDPARLRDTIFNNFGIPIDHYVQVDFCAFKTLVDAVGGVEVPFETPVRDTRSGLNVSEAGCFNFDGEHALAYVRSRYFEYEDPAGSGNWRRDGTADLGRISRQQDFLRRTVASILNRGAYTPSVARALLETNSKYLTVDTNLTLNRMLEFAGLIQNLDPDQIQSYQIEFTPRTISGNAVLVPQLNSENMRQILAVFRGEASITSVGEQVFESDISETSRPGETTTLPATDEDPNTSIEMPLPEVDPAENLIGIAPQRDLTC